MRTSSRVKRITLSALLLASALILSYIETLFPLAAVVKIPGFKLGFANMAVMLVYFNIGPAEAAAVSLLKVILSSVLFGSVSGFWFSLTGAAAAYSALTFSRYILRSTVSYIGTSMLCAALHNTGQLIAAAILFGDSSVFWYLPYLLIISIFTGAVTGTPIKPLSDVFRKLYNE